MMSPEEMKDYKAYLATQGMTPAEADQYIQYATSTGNEVSAYINEAADVDGRFMVKNFGNDNEASIKYLKQQNPGIEAKVVDGDIVIKSPGAGDWKKLDPANYNPLSGGFWKDLPSDLGDVAYDVASGPISALSTLAGGIAGSLALPGVGTAAGAYTGAAAGSAATEGLRQKIGEMTGVNDEVKSGDVVTAGVLGGVTAPFMGAGKIAGSQSKNLAGALLRAVGLDNVAEQELKGGVKNTYDYVGGRVLPKVGQFVSGIDADTTRAYFNNMGLVDDLGEQGVTDYLTKKQVAASKGFNEMKTKAGKAVRESIDNYDGKVDISGAKQSYQAMISELEQKANLTNIEAAQLEQLKGVYNKAFGVSGAEGQYLDDAVDANRAFDLQQNLKRFAAFDQNMTPESAVIQAPSQRAYSAVNESLDSATMGASGDAKKTYKQLVDVDALIGTKFDDPQKFYQAVTSLDKKGSKVLSEKLLKLAEGDSRLDLKQTSDVLKAYDAFTDPALNAISSGGTTSTSRSNAISSGLEAAGEAVGGKVLGKATGMLGSLGASPASVKGMIKTAKEIDGIPNALKARFPKSGQTLIDLINVSQRNNIAPRTLLEMMDETD